MLKIVAYNVDTNVADNVDDDDSENVENVENCCVC